MAAASQPARVSTFSERIAEVLQHTRANIECSRELIQASREHCESSRRLIEVTTRLREFLRENVLNVWSRREHWLDVGRMSSG